MKEKLIESMEVQKTASNGKLILDKKTGEPLSQLVLIGRENEELFAYMISFIVTGKEKNDLQINKKRCPGSDCASVFYGGNIGEIKKFLESGNYNEFNSLDLTGKIKYFIQLEIKKNPFKVGEPINIIQLTKTGDVWLSRNGNCPIVFE
ncbi:MAG: hypothetical protein HOA90_03985 [Prolixibacteraceae bacterium]|nr:hypothetical protein [Prolixibacteraceae bacterium]